MSLVGILAFAFAGFVSRWNATQCDTQQWKKFHQWVSICCFAAVLFQLVMAVSKYL